MDPKVMAEPVCVERPESWYETSSHEKQPENGCESSHR